MSSSEPTATPPEHRRVRRSSRRRRGRRRRVLLVVAALALLLVVTGAAATSVYRDGRAVERSLEVARTAIGELRSSVARGDVEAAEDQLERARLAVAAADDDSSGPLWRITARLPVVGRSTGIVQRVVAVADASVRLADAGLERAPDLLSGSSGELQVTDGAFDLGRLKGVAEVLEDLPVARLAFARERLAAAGVDLVPASVRDARRDALHLAGGVVGTVEDARTLLDVLPSFLGVVGERRYLLGVQTSAELRGTGGLLGYVGVLVVEDGRMRLGQTDVVDPTAGEVQDDDRADGLTELGGRVDEPVPTGPDFRDRYGPIDATTLFSNVNLDPHLPTTGPVVLDLYEAYTGQSLDGMLALDPVGLGLILSAIGPIDVPTAGLEGLGGLPTTIPPEDVAPVTLIDVYESLGSGQSAARSAYFSALSRGAFERIFSGSWDALAVARRLGDAASGRHVQLYSTFYREQEAFERLGLAGALPDARRPEDLLAITANNAVGGKQDVHVGHHFEADIALGDAPAGPDGRVVERTAELRVEVENPLPSSGMDEYIIGNCLPGGGRCFDGPPGWNRTWFTVWTDQTTVPVEVRDEDGDTAYALVDDIHGHRAVDQTIEVPPQDRAAFEVDLAGEVPLRREGAELVYDLLLWRQAKAIPDHWDVSIAPPAGWHVTSVHVEGGGSGTGMGVAGNGTPLVGSVGDDGHAVVSGAATADARIEVRFARPAKDRLWDWFRQPAF